VFCYSKQGYYTHFDLEFIYEHKDKFVIFIELDTSVEFNALLYGNSACGQGENGAHPVTDGIACKNIFSRWFEKTTEIKEKCKGNLLAKHIRSSLWGSLVKMKKSYYTEDEFSVLDVDDDGTSKYYPIDETLFYKNNRLNRRFECIEIEKPYKSSFGRLKPFILSLSRFVVGNTIIKNGLIDKVIRVHTDGIVLNKPFDFSKFEVLGLIPIPEKKTTGLITWFNVNKYNNPSLGKMESN
jgi:hypothetical protein